MGHDPHVVVVREGEDGVLLNADNSTYCGSCYGSQQHPEECCNTCADVRERYRMRGWAFSTAGTVEQCKREGMLESIALQAGEGCQVYGHFEVNKVAGNFHFAPGKSFQQGNMHVHDLMAFGLDAYFNMSHVVHSLAFGEEYPGQLNPLDGAQVWQTGPHLMYQYFVKVVPTVYVDIKGKKTRTAQFSIMEHPKCVSFLFFLSRASGADGLRAQERGHPDGAEPAGHVCVLRHQPHPGEVRGAEGDLHPLLHLGLRNCGGGVHRLGHRGLLRLPWRQGAQEEDGAGKTHLRRWGGEARRGGSARAACGVGAVGGACAHID